MEPLQGKSIASVIKGIVHLMVREKGPYFMSELFYSLFILSLSFFQEN